MVKHSLLEDFFSQFPRITIPNKTIIISPEDEINFIYYIEHGKVRMFVESPEGEEITLHIFNEHSYIPIMVALTNQSNNYYFQSTEQVIARKVPVDEIITFLKTHPEELFDLATKFSFAIGGLAKRIETLASSDAYHKVLNFLRYFAQKYGPAIPLTHEEIASWLGLKRETVSRQIKKLQKEGVVKYENEFLIVTKVTE